MLYYVWALSLSNRKKETLTFLGTKGESFLYEKYSLVIKNKSLTVNLQGLCLLMFNC